MAKENVEGAIDKIVGKVKQKTGEAIGDQKLANAGAAQQVKGSAKEAAGSVKDATKRVAKPKATKAKIEAEETGAHLRDNIVAGAERASEAVKHVVHRIEHPHDERDIRQVQ
ncbi:Uncharacterized conserved protein YjbJ, UPF0337 family [Granulicella rosea]|uniref:Uncharacterized conserved protein YjbJ, UPF0337 family n=1 Tax=Granulicella rosea TaxID=474952 RepID=A0A239E3I3_9BACT|nr:CsbD family protein [Granulicella rosea]SNS38553.1 Uncharacterized conserved protein YjbJ, UPF0337 family [Granulicella rosea]